MYKYAFLFPGQGSQYVGMLDAFLHEPIVLQTIEEANDSLGENIGDVIKNGPIDVLNSTIYTQPAILAASIATYRLYVQHSELAQNISMFAGHSLGEYSALVAANCLTFSDAIKLVRVRAQAMQDAVSVGAGGMAAIIGLNAENIQKICIDISMQKTYGIVEVANYNSKEQTVIAGHLPAIEQACDLLKQQGAKRCLVLPVSAPFHSSLLQPASMVLKNYLDNVSMQEIIDKQYINNVDVASPSKIEDIKHALVRQVAKSVRWVETIESMFIHHHINGFIECGPGKVLQGLVKRILPNDADIKIFGTENPSAFITIF
jgi:[acyl-carrier-protein] S-malonyltransferase